MSDIFISYARSAQGAAELVDRTLSRVGYSVWRDAALPIHRPYPQEIEAHLRAAKAVVVLWSKDAAASDWVRAEADLARESAKLVQVSLDATLPPMPFNQIQCGDLTGWAGDIAAPAWRRLLASLAALAGEPEGDPKSAPPERSAAAAPPLLAVLPFDNLSGDQDLLYFSDGLSEEILQTVAKTAGLKVIGRSSSFQFRGAAKAARHVGAELGCTHVLDGSVRRGGERVRVTAQLVECAGQTTLWSDRFDRLLADVFALQDEIAGAVAEALKLAFAPSAALGPIDPVAYDLYLRSKTQDPGRLGSFNPGLLEAATAIAPGFAQAWQALAITHAVDALFAPSGEGVGALRASAAKAAAKALALDPAAGQAYVALSLIEPVCGRFAERERLLEQALSASPNDPIVLFHASRAAYTVGRAQEALGLIEAAHRLDLWPQGENWYCVMLTYGGRPGEGAEVWRQAIERWPTYEILTVNGIVGATGSGDWERLDALADQAHRLGVDSAWLRDALETARVVREGGPQAKEQLLAPLRRQLAASGTMSLRVGAACAMGYVDEVYGLLSQASFDHLFEPDARLVGNDFGLHVIFQSPPLMRDLRFVELCARLGLCDYWVAGGRWPDCAEALAPIYDFKAEARRLAGRRPRRPPKASPGA